MQTERIHQRKAKLQINPWLNSDINVLSAAAWRPTRRSIDRSRYEVERSYDGIRVYIQLEGLQKSTVRVKLTEDGLEVTGQKKDELGYVLFEDMIEIDTTGIVGTVKAQFQKNVLEVFLPTEMHYSVQ